MRIPDNYDLWEAHDRDLERMLKRRPVCEKCNKHIQDEFYFYIDGETLCQECMEDQYMLPTEDYGE